MSLSHKFAAIKATVLPHVRLVAVSKYKPIEDIREVYEAGHRVFGENYIQELLTKAPELPHDIEWHFIGTLQSNKIKQLISAMDGYDLVIETVDSMKKVDMLQKLTERSIKIFVQVNTSGEESKSGLAPHEVIPLVKHIKEQCPKVVFQGLMTIGSVEHSHLGGVNPDFVKLAELRREIGRELHVEESGIELSMGMSGDYLQAIEMGSTNVRIGSSIFGARPTK